MKSVVDVNNLSSTEFFLKIKSHDSEEENTIRTISEKVSKVIRKTFNFQDLKKAHRFSMFPREKECSQQHSFYKGKHISKINLREVLSITGWQEGDLEAQRRWSETGT